MTTTTTNDPRAEWVAWLETYGAGAFFDSFMGNAQGTESTCVNCGLPIYLDIAEGGGVPDWGSRIGCDIGAGLESDGTPVDRTALTPLLDYGCDDSPDTTDDGVGSHVARSLRREARA